jgi:hypothetical protein
VLTLMLTVVFFMLFYIHVTLFFYYMAVLKTDVKRITISIPKVFLQDLDQHINNFALTDRSRWLIDAAKEKMAKEKEMLSEMEQDNDVS